MSLFKFHDSNFINVPNLPNVVATSNTYNGNVFALDYDATISGTTYDVAATPLADATAAQAGDFYIMSNIIDKPEILNTEDYKVIAGEYIRAYKAKDIVGLFLDLAGDLVTDTYSGVSKGDKLIPRSVADTTNTMKWKVDAASGYEVYLEVVKKTTFGSFTVDAAGGDVPGGYLCVVRSTN
jgi:hypothetical protein